MNKFLAAGIIALVSGTTVPAQEYDAIDALEGVWSPTHHQAYPFEPCYDAESPYRVAIGRYRWDNEAYALRFGEEQGEERRIGFYESSCSLERPMSNGGQLAAAAECVAEGEESAGFVTIRTIDDQTIAVSTPIGNGEQFYSACKVDHAAIAWPQPPAKIYYGSRAGMHMTVRGAAALDTEAATVYLEHTEEDARAFCVGYVLDIEPECVTRSLEENADLLRQITADCTVGTFITPYGTRYHFRGVNRSDDQFAPEFAIYNAATGEIADGSSASSYGEALAAFQALCPSTFASAE